MKILVVCLAGGKGLPASSAELLGGARSLASGPGDSVVAAVLGQGIAETCREAAAFGAEAVYAVDDAALSEFDTESQLRALEAVVAESEPTAVLFTADGAGADLGPRLAARLGTGAVTEAVALRLSEEGQIVFTRPVYGGRLMAEMVVPGRPAVATMAAGVFQALPRNPDRDVEIRLVGPHLEVEEPALRVLEVQREESLGIPLETARVVISGGRGLGSAANFQYLEDLARVLGAAVGASRAAVDDGWATIGRQVGQTGKKVAPDLYVAVGISGATQHVAGMSRAKHVLVVNTDPEAPFFRIAEVGVVVDYQKLLPALTARLRALLGTG